MNLKKFLSLICLSLICFFSGCGVDYQFKKAESLKEKGDFLGAIRKYELVIEKDPDNVRIPEAFYNIGKIYQKNLENNPEAKKNYKQVMENYSSTEWAKVAKESWLEIADYFPLVKKSKWNEVDSETFGKYMTAKNEIIAVQDDVFEMARNLYVRDRLVSGFKKYFKKTKEGFYETNKDGKIITTILLLPIEVNKEWTVGNIKYTIMSKNEEVSVNAGKFLNCVKTKKQLSGTPSWSYEYYAPEVGKILTTQSSGASEKRITELKEYNIPVE